MPANSSSGSTSDSSDSDGPIGQGNYVVKQGDCIESIAFNNGLFWETVWNDPDNEELKRVRKDPNVLLPGDKVRVIEKRKKQDPEALEQRHRYRRKGVPSILRMQLLEDGEPRANVNYILKIDGKSFTGATDDQGRFEQVLPPAARSGKLKIEGEEGEEYTLNLRHIDPIEQLSGVQARLSNLGFDPGGVDGRMRPTTETALNMFQERNGLEITGEPDQPTRDKLLELHGC